MTSGVKEQINAALKLHQTGALDEAEKLYEEILKNTPDSPDALNLFGMLKLQKSLFDEAEICIKKAIQIKPDLYFYGNLGRVYLEGKKFDSAIEIFENASKIDPKNFDYWFNLAIAHRNKEQFDEGIQAYKEALAINPLSSEAHFNIAYLYLCKSDPNTAIDYYKKALELNPEDSETKYFLSLAYLQVKNFDEGLKYYESRLCRESSILTQSITYPEVTKRSPVWQGEPAEDKTIFTYYEAGYGDVIMYARYLPLLRARCKKVLFQPQYDMAPLFVNNNFDCEILMSSRLEGGMDFDFHLPLMSLPYVLGLKGEENFISSKGYLKADEQKAKFYKDNYFNNDKFKIGIKWQGNTYYDMGRVIKIESFFKLFDLPDTKFYSVQTYEGAEKLEKLQEQYDIVDLGKTFGDFADTAGALENFDLIICNDTSIAHLAGALGKPCWILLPHVYNWRWHMDMNRCDWYDSVRLFRQESPDNWDGVFDRVRDELDKVLKNRGQK